MNFINLNVSKPFLHWYVNLPDGVYSGDQAVQAKRPFLKLLFGLLRAILNKYS
jgi:hypothetical protein